MSVYLSAGRDSAASTRRAPPMPDIVREHAATGTPSDRRAKDTGHLQHAGVYYATLP